MHTPLIRSTVAIVAALSLGLAACGSDGAESSGDEVAGGDVAETDTGSVAASSTAQDDDLGADIKVPTIAVTTNVLGDVLREVVGSSAEVVTIMPVGADPHDFQASAQEVDAMNSADALIVNGADFEEGLLDVIDGAGREGVPTFAAISAISTIDFGEGGDEHSDEEHSDEEHSDEEHADDEHSDDEHSDEEHSDEEHSDEEHSDEEHSDEEHSDEEHSGEEHDDHGHSGVDPHFFTDPTRMAEAVEGIVAFLQDQIEFADPAALNASADEYIAELTALDSAVAELVAVIPEQRRVLVTNHEVFGYFADRYGFEVVGAVIPSGSTTDSASAGELAELAEKVEANGVPAIFADTSSSGDVIDALASEVGDIAVVELYTESLGDSDSDGATYLQMVLANAQRMSDSLS